MSLRLALAVLALLLFGAFVAVNWSAFLAPTTLSLLVTSIEAPLGLVLLGVLAGVAAVFLATLAWWQGRVLLETRRHTQELQAQRALADQAEASRFTALQVEMKSELSALATRIDASAAQTREALQDSGNSLAASIGELEDRVERALEPLAKPLLPR